MNSEPLLGENRPTKEGKFSLCLEDEIMLLELITEDGLTPTRKGPDEWSSPCPACGGRDRFIIHPERGRYWCRGCGNKGDAIQYLRDHRNMSFHQAAEFAGRPMESSLAGRKRARNPQESARATTAPPHAAWTAQVEKLITEKHKALVSDPWRLGWLLEFRGLTRDTAKRFRLGWNERDIYMDRAALALHPELRTDGKPKKLPIPAGLLIPGPDRLRVRRMEPGRFGKYYVVPGSGNAPLVIGAEHPVKATGAVIVESELDAMLLWQEIPTQVLIVATGSTSNGPDEAMAADLNRRPFVLVALDTDTAGAKAAWGKWMGTIPNATRTPIPATWGTDPTDAFLAGHDLGEWFRAALRVAGCHSGNGMDLQPAAPPLETTGPPVAGLPCGGCGRTVYRRVIDGFTYPDGTLADGWHCSTPGCSVKLMANTNQARVDGPRCDQPPARPPLPCLTT
ncbi:CHC2 zinc finger domain-containing protein [Desulfobulbus alkaliphilus]|uniref:CHC2 zinc finger domain-containing protein n=1 Tax=Desulfobulbus alkaliphilus TaxID=869814 RepID=UPI0019664D6E|nr:CHC2 zinc finger domain-containing protein [Desulfobulbus alkaliphilus]MBM9536172.1 toprim domain-containing protein [Desulfobulbus alkaliphilus]